MGKDEKDIYELVCRDRFDKMENMQQQTLDLLRGKNSDPGLVDDVRGLKKVYKSLIGAFIFIVSVLVLQAAAWIRTAYFS